MNDPLTEEDRRLLTTVISEAHEQSWGIVIGLVFGLLILIATNVLIIKGGDPVGPHLSLLSAYFPGYSVTVVGSFVGFVYLFVIGYGMGRITVTLYNRLNARFRRY